MQSAILEQPTQSGFSAIHFSNDQIHQINQESDMAFVYEQCGEVEMREILKLKPYLPFGWYGSMVVDRERNIRLLSLGGKGSTPEARGEPPSYFLLIVDGQLVPFETRYVSESPSEGWKYSMTVRKPQIPPQLQSMTEQIELFIREALLAFWRGVHSQTSVQSVTVTFETSTAD